MFVCLNCMALKKWSFEFLLTLKNQIHLHKKLDSWFVSEKRLSRITINSCSWCWSFPLDKDRALKFTIIPAHVMRSLTVRANVSCYLLLHLPFLFLMELRGKRYNSPVHVSVKHLKTKHRRGHSFSIKQMAESIFFVEGKNSPVCLIYKVLLSNE